MTRLRLNFILTHELMNYVTKVKQSEVWNRNERIILKDFNSGCPPICIWEVAVLLNITTGEALMKLRANNLAVGHSEMKNADYDWFDTFE